jgi:hypothetical protein
MGYVAQAARCVAPFSLWANLNGIFPDSLVNRLPLRIPGFPIRLDENSLQENSNSPQILLENSKIGSVDFSHQERNRTRRLMDWSNLVLLSILQNIQGG